MNRLVFFCIGLKNNNFGGSELQLISIANELYKISDYQISFITSNEYKGDYLLSGIKFIPCINTKKSLLNYLIFPFSVFKALHNSNGEIFIASSAGVEIGLISLFCKILNKKFIFRCASSVDCTYEKIKQLGKIKGNIYKFGLTNTDFVVTQNVEDKKNLLSYHNIQSHVIKNGIKTTNTNQSLLSKKYIIWVGSARPLKQPELFIKLASNFPNEKFLMIMPKSDNILYWKKISMMARQKNNIRFIEKVSYDKIQKYFDQSKILVGTSTHEGFPNVYLQSCVSSTPIVSLNVNPDHFITKYRLGYVSNGQFKKMIAEVNRLLSNEKIYNEMSNNANKYVKLVHDINNISSKWKQILNKI